MQIYAALLVFGQVVASIGPWPGDIEGCKANVPQSARDIDEAFADPVKRAELHEAYPGLTRDRVEWSCIESAERPKVVKDTPLSPR